MTGTANLDEPAANPVNASSDIDLTAPVMHRSGKQPTDQAGGSTGTPSTSARPRRYIKEELFDDGGYIKPDRREEFIPMPSAGTPTHPLGGYAFHNGEFLYPPTAMQGGLDVVRRHFEVFASHFNSYASSFRTTLGCISQMNQNAGEMNSEVFASLSRSRQTNKYLDKVLKDKDSEITALHLTLEEKQAELDETKRNSGDPEVARRLRKENSDLNKVNEGLAEELKAAQSAIDNLVLQHERQNADNAEKIKDLQLQLSSRLEEQAKFDEHFMTPNQLPLDPTGRIARCEELGGFLKKMATASRIFVRRLFPERVQEARCLNVLPDLLMEGAADYENRLASAARGGATMALGLTKIHYDEAEIHLIASGVPQDVTAESASKTFAAVAGYATKVAKMVNLKIFHREVECPSTPTEQESETSSEED